MGRRKSVAQLQRQLKYAQARAKYVPPEREPGGSVQRRPKTPVRYQAIFDSGSAFYSVQTSSPGIAFFGGIAALGLAADAGDPRLGGRPNMIKATVADGTPTRVRALPSGRSYIRYAAGSRNSNTQVSFSAALSADTATAVRTRFNTVADSIKSKLGGDYGRVWLEPERLKIVESGVGI